MSDGAGDRPSGGHPLFVSGVLAAPLTSLIADLVFPHLRLSAGAAIVLATATATLPALVSIWLVSKAAPRLQLLVPLVLAGALGVGVIYARGVTSIWWLPLATGSIVALGAGVGSLIGSRVEHAGHVLPAAFVAAAADTVSVLHPSGASNAIARSDRALSALALGAPVPGADAMTFVLGVGDLTFAALLFAVAARHGVSAARVFLAIAVGVVASLAVAAATGVPIPALVGIGGAAIAIVPQFRESRRRERTITQLAIALSIAVALGMILRALVG